MLARLSKSTLTLLSGTVLGQAVVLAISPVLSRLYSPQEFGEFSIYVVILYVFMAISAGRYDSAITIADTTKEAISLTRLSVIFSTISSLLLFSYLSIHLSIQHQDFVKSLQYLLPLSVLLAGINTALGNLQLRRQRQRNVAVSRSIQALSSSTAQVIFGNLRMGLQGLIAGQAIGLFMSLAFLLKRRILTIIRPTRSNPRNILRKYAAFPRFEMVSALIVVANNHTPTILIGLLSTTSSAGAYALAQRIIATPLNIIANAISTSTLAFGYLKDDAKDKLIISTVNSLADSINSIIVLVGFCFIYAFGLIFGSQWAAAGVVAGWICLPAGSKFRSDSTFAITTTNKKQREGVKIQLRLLVFKVAPLAVTLPILDINTAIIAFSIINAVTHHTAAKRISTQIIEHDKKSEIRFWGTLILSCTLLLAATHDTREIVAITLPLHLILLAANFHSTFTLFKRAL